MLWQQNQVADQRDLILSMVANNTWFYPSCNPSYNSLRMDMVEQHSEKDYGCA